MAKESSFFAKLKKGMGAEEPIEEKMDTAPPLLEVEKKPKMKKPKNQGEFKVKTEPVESTPRVEKEKECPPPQKTVLSPAKVKPSTAQKEKEGGWFEPEGQLAIDVYQTKDELVVQSAIAGVKPENLDVSIESDILTIRGSREKPFQDEENYFTQECYWGPFSREIIVPVEVDPTRIKAAMKEGILTIRIPKIERERKRKIAIER